MASEDVPKTTPDTTGTAAPRRRSSGFMPAFEGLQQQRLNANPTRRQSLSDQQVKPGVFGQFFHNTFGKNAK